MSLAVVGEILDRAHSGPICPVSKWDGQVVPEKTQTKLKEYDLTRCFKENSSISSDNILADEFYKAAFELAVELGMLCVNTETLHDRALQNATMRRRSDQAKNGMKDTRELGKSSQTSGYPSPRLANIDPILSIDNQRKLYSSGWCRFS